MKMTVIKVLDMWCNYRNQCEGLYLVQREDGKTGKWQTTVDTCEGKIHNSNRCNVKWEA